MLRIQMRMRCGFRGFKFQYPFLGFFDCYENEKSEEKSKDETTFQYPFSGFFDCYPINPMEPEMREERSFNTRFQGSSIATSW
ncbi:MAG: hypothetical protein NZ879_08495, partial [Archaeoglobaceae archaeon]|nr:hypothetical protein [Archaeoglobaceae archaeon]MDW8119003.1 hypothetical protein [Archaeoglobaceae archaeon]